MRTRCLESAPTRIGLSGHGTLSPFGSLLLSSHPVRADLADFIYVRSVETSACRFNVSHAGNREPLEEPQRHFFSSIVLALYGRPQMPGDPREYRQHATRCAELATNVKDVEFKATYLALSRQWEMFAAELEAAEAKLKELNEGAVNNCDPEPCDAGRGSQGGYSNAAMQTMLHPEQQRIGQDGEDEQHDRDGDHLLGLGKRHRIDDEESKSAFGREHLGE